MNGYSVTGPYAPGRHIFILDVSKRCEPSAYLFTKAVHFFLVNGYEVVKDIDHSEIILVNTCCVTEDKISTSVAAVDSARAHGNGKTIVLLGCMAGLPVGDFKREGLICIGPKSLGELDRLFPHRVPVDRITVNQMPPALYSPGQGLGYNDYFLMIAQGCVNRCSYCNIKRAKGEVTSEPAGAILRQLHHGLSRGRRDFTLVADDCASYGRDCGTDLVRLLEQMFAAGPLVNVKLGYMFPRFLLTEFDRLRQVFSTGRVRYVNIPIQSGSQQILELMNRRYDINEVMGAIRQLRAAAPETVFCTHIMINFPTESDDDFLKSLALVDDFDEVIFLHYSDNRDTAAAGIFPKVPVLEAVRRLETASNYANQCKPGRSAVIRDFNCDIPYNMLSAVKE